ncbi:MAG: L-seryl-tRNA(Sec) selenium transferase [Burkholderiaceae bacterium]|nr:L-seryl-tRNA(Sec) selenium transferase [Roseateles sp.]MBV8470993.1 L-seryl-tRNA(Sec) selenium transferase [Burkholderiaceae bacterium]
MRAPEASMVHGLTAQQEGEASGPPPASPKDLPAVDRLLRSGAVQVLVQMHGHQLVAAEARGLLEAWRAQALAGQLRLADIAAEVAETQLAARCRARLAPNMKTVLNLSGTVLHTNLGRAVLADQALAHVTAMMAGPNNLEFDLATGARGDRDDLVESLLCEITGAEAATVVNNNAAAVLLSIAALSAAHPGGREVIVSRGELVEIGGAFRMPDVMAAAGAQLVEVGTTNRTHLRDYEAAITPRSAMLMKVHTSNYAIQGFTSAVDESQLAPLAHAHGLPLVTDLGSGSLVDLSAYGLPREPLPQDMLRAGCDVVTFSGDKLLGGPQAGLIVGSREAITRIRKFPMKRALRMSKLPLAALEATLRLYLRPELLAQSLPTLRWLTRPQADIRLQAQRLQAALAQALAPRYQVHLRDLQGQIGSGSLPVERLPSAGFAIAPVSGPGLERPHVGTALDALSKALRQLPQPVVGRIADDALLLDLRCLDLPAHEAAFLAQLPRLQEMLA